MTRRPIVVTAEPTGAARWHIDVPSHGFLVTRTLATGRTMIERRVEAAFDLHVRLGGLEDLCADVVDIGQRSDAASVDAIRQRRRAALTLTAAGIRRTDVAYLMGIPSMAVGHLLAVPIDSAWMTAGHAPPTRFPRARDAVTHSDGTRRMSAVVVTRDGVGWQVALDAGSRSTRRTSLVHAHKLARELAGDTDVVMCPQLPDDLAETLRACDLASATAHDLEVQAYECRLVVARRLRALSVGFADIGELLAIHPHRVRLLLSRR